MKKKKPDYSIVCCGIIAVVIGSLILTFISDVDGRVLTMAVVSVLYITFLMAGVSKIVILTMAIGLAAAASTWSFAYMLVGTIVATGILLGSLLGGLFADIHKIAESKSGKRRKVKK